MKLGRSVPNLMGNTPSTSYCVGWHSGADFCQQKHQKPSERQRGKDRSFFSGSLLQVLSSRTKQQNPHEKKRWAGGGKSDRPRAPPAWDISAHFAFLDIQQRIRLFGKTKEEISDALAIKVLLFTIFNLSPSHCFWFFLLKIPESLPEVLWEKNQVCVFRGIRVQPSALLQVFCIFPFEFNTLIIDTLLLLIRVTNVIYNYEQGK